MGGHVEACNDCGHWRVAYNSCRNRHCPRCQGAAARTWLAEREADLLPVGYFHVVFTLTMQDGTPIAPIGDVTFSTTRFVGDMVDVEAPYWLTSYSTDLDPRLFADFASADGDDAALVIFDPMEFIRRSLPHLNAAAPFSLKRLHQIDYYDVFHPPSERLAPLTMKDTRFAYQREWRMILDPVGNEALGGDDGVLFVDVGSIADIAGVYAPNGRKLEGTGPESFLAEGEDARAAPEGSAR